MQKWRRSKQKQTNERGEETLPVTQLLLQLEPMVYVDCIYVYT